MSRQSLKNVMMEIQSAGTDVTSSALLSQDTYVEELIEVQGALGQEEMEVMQVMGAHPTLALQMVETVTWLVGALEKVVEVEVEVSLLCWFEHIALVIFSLVILVHVVVIQATIRLNLSTACCFSQVEEVVVDLEVLVKKLLY